MDSSELAIDPLSGMFYQKHCKYCIASFKNLGGEAASNGIVCTLEVIVAQSCEAGVNN